MAKSLVLVIGAGASKEVNLPIGAELRSKIAEALDIRYEDGCRRISGDRIIDDAFRAIAQTPNGLNINPYLHSSWRIRDAMPQAISIDNFIDSHRGDQQITICGKIAIARCILVAEAESTLYVDRMARYQNQKIDFSMVEPTWFNVFFQLLTENCQEQDIEARLDQVAIITFNYDRCIEHYLHGALQNYFGVSPERAAEALKRLLVFHPYGSVGALPWQQSGEGIEFGAEVGGRRLIEVSKGIRTFTEGISRDRSDTQLIQSTLQHASRIAFLGFAFHPLNLDLLFPTIADAEPNRPAFATGLGISPSDGQEIINDLSRRQAIRKLYLRHDLTCANLLREYWRSLRFS